MTAMTGRFKAIAQRRLLNLGPKPKFIDTISQFLVALTGVLKEYGRPEACIQQ